MFSKSHIQLTKFCTKGACFLLFFILYKSVFSQTSQKEGNIWYFGNKAGIDFNTSPPTNLTNGALSTIEGCASICNKYGNLLFYTDGIYVYDKTHSIMNNGGGLLGNSSSTQSGIIVPNPDSTHIYYVFSTSGYNNLFYSIVDTTLNAGLGSVTVKNVPLMPNGTEKLNAIKHSNNKDVWVVSHQRNNNAYYAYKVSGAGVDTTPVISMVGSNFISGISPGYLKFSPDGKKLVCADYNGVVEMLDFNQSNGVISNANTLINNTSNYGVEFSPSGNYLYITSPFKNPQDLTQYDLKAGNIAAIIASKVTIATITSYNPGGIQLAPDGKIYMALYPNSPYLGVINFPEKKGTACDFVANGFLLSPKTSSFGLPSFNQSFFSKGVIDIKPITPECGQLTFDFQNTGDTNILITSKWDFGDGTADTGRIVKKTYATHGTYTIKNILEIGGDVPYTDSVFITINTLPKPEAKIVPLKLNTCFNENITILKDTSDYKGLGKTSSKWWYSDTAWVQNNVDTITRVYSRPTFRVPYFKPDTIKLIITAANGCMDSLVYSPHVRYSVEADFTVLGSQCFDQNVFTPVSSTFIDDGNTSIRGIRWDFGDGTNDTGAFVQKKYTDTGTYKIRMVALATPSNCHDTVYNTFTVLPSPVASFTTGDVCYRDSTLIQNNTTIKSGTIKYNWNFGDGNTDTSQKKNHLYADTGAFTIQLIAASNWMCTDTFVQPVQIKPKPNANFNYAKHCEKNVVQFTDNTQRFNIPALNNNWIFGNGNTSPALGNASNTYNNPGNYIVKLVAAGSNGCTDSISKNIYINPIPTVDFTINDSAQCLKQNQFVFGGNTKVSSGSIVSRQWFINSQPFVSGFSGTKNFTTDGLYNIKLVAITDSACADSATKIITVHPQANLAIGVDDPQQCLSTNLFTFSNNSTIASGTLNYVWSFSTGDSYSLTTPPAQSFPVPGLYDVLLMSESDMGCKDTINERVTVDYNPKADFVVQTICENDSAVFVNTTLGAAGGWLWNFGDGTTSTMEKPTHKFSGPGIYQVSLVGQSGNGCSDTVTKDSGVIVQAAPKVYFTAEIPGNINGVTAVSFKNFTQFANNYSWAFGNGNFSRTVHPVENYTDTGYYRVSLSAINDFNCFDDFDTVIYIAPDFDLHIPNAFSPNKDPLNTVFKVEGTYYYKTFEMYIYDGWGGLLFYTNNPKNGWDGKKNGEALPDGAYVYYIRMIGTNKNIHAYRGTVYLVR